MLSKFIFEIATGGPRRTVRGQALGWLAALIAGTAPVAAADYRLGAGDSLEITVVGMTDFRYKLPVDLQGEIAVPYVGALSVSGKTVPELRKELQERLPTKLIRQRTLEGRDVPVVVLPEEVVVTVAEYRPVYVNGDVAHPGEQPFRPGMTVRKALALAGGYDIMRFRASNPFLDSADLRGEYESLLTSAAKDQLQIWRIQIMLGQRTSFDLKSLPQTQAVADLATTEDAQLKVLEADFTKEKGFLVEASRKATAQLATLTSQRSSETEGLKADSEDYDRLKDLMQRGTVPMLRISDARRNVLLSSTRWLQAAAQVTQLERDRDEIDRKVVRLADQRRSDLLKELQEATTRLNATRARMDAVSEKMLYTGIVKSQIVRGKGGKPSLSIFRNEEGVPRRMDVQEDADLFPGDTIEVALTTEYAVGLGSR